MFSSDTKQHVNGQKRNAGAAVSLSCWAASKDQAMDTFQGAEIIGFYGSDSTNPKPQNIDHNIGATQFEIHYQAVAH